MNRRILSDYGVQLAIMDDRAVGGQNRGFHWRPIAVGEDPIERNLNHVLVIQLNLIVTTGIEESIERLLQLGFELSDNADDPVARNRANTSRVSFIRC